GAIGAAAGGATVATVLAVAATRVRQLLVRLRSIDGEIGAVESRLRALVTTEAAERSAELERTLARARADSASLLNEQERRIAEERRTAAAERERQAGASLSAGIAAAQQQVEARLRAWTEDLDRARRVVDDQLAQLAQRQRQLISDAEARIASDAERLEAESEQQRVGLMKLRDDLARAIEQTVSTGNAELETYAAERRRALHDINERIRRRERALAEQISREETEVTRRLTEAFADAERRQVEKLQRVLDRATSGYADLAAQQFSDAIRSAREDAATRLSRELDRAVQSFAREAERILGEQLSHVGDAGAQRLEKRLNQAAAGLERQRAEAMGGFEERLLLAEQELRRRLDGIAADADAERAVIEARLQDLARRLDEAIARA
ncbi:MAG TPA: hypothetical protein VJZ00_12130, partial [Thermoanaerobaculia bacterium]|nr:hypothetical protein [Thermoanaerobaculia bacterium]